VGWAIKVGRQLCVGIAPRRIELRLGEKDGAGEVSTTEVSGSAVSPQEVSQSQVGASEVSSDEVCPSQVGASEIGTCEIGPGEIGSSTVDLPAPVSAPHQFARPQQQSIDISSVCCHVQFHKSVGTVVSETFGLVERDGEFTVERAGGLQRQGFGQVPEQLMELPHDHEDLKHPLRGSWRPAPVFAAECDLGDLLPGAEALVNGTTRKAPLPQGLVDAAAEVRLQIGTWLPGVFVDRKICRGREGRRNAAQPEAALAVSSQAEATSVAFLGQRLCFLPDSEHAKDWMGRSQSLEVLGVQCRGRRERRSRLSESSSGVSILLSLVRRVNRGRGQPVGTEAWLTEPENIEEV
jgi:hypothetical protein